MFDLIEKKEEPETGVDEINELNVDMETGEILPQEPVKQSSSPIYRRYLEIQEQYPNHVIAYRLGDFYEIFGDNAIRISNELDLTLTGRDCGLASRVPMIGFPYHASDTYFDKIRKLHPLAVVDQDEVSLMQINQSIEEETTSFEDNLEEETQNEPTMYEDNGDFTEELTLNQYFDKEALCILYELFDYNLDIQ